MKITLCGHSSIPRGSTAEQELEKAVREIFLRAERGDSLTFYCGGYGQFDFMAARAVNAARALFKDVRCENLLVTPYITESHARSMAQAMTLFDGTVYPPLENVPYRLCIARRNRWMIEQADIVVAYVKHARGGAFSMLEYAKRRGKTIISI